MRERYRIFRLPRKALAIRKALLQSAAEVTHCPDCAHALRNTTTRHDVPWHRWALHYQVAALWVRTNRCDRCDRWREDRGIAALLFREEERVRLIATAWEERVDSAKPANVFDPFCYPGDLFYALGLFLPLLRLLGRLGGKRWAPAAVITRTALVLIRGRDFTPLLRAGCRILVAEESDYRIDILACKLVSPFLAVETTNPLCDLDEGERRLLGRLLICASEEEAERVLALQALADDL